MKRILKIATLLLIAGPGFSQSNKELKKMFLEARDSGLAQYVILNTGEKKEIKDLSFPSNLFSNKGKIEFTDGKVEKYEDGRIRQCQTNEGFYKFVRYQGDNITGSLFDSALATRRNKGPINVYHLLVRYRAAFTKEISTATFYFFELENNGRLIQLKNDPKQVDEVEKYVAGSARARNSIAELRKRYGKLSIGFSTSTKLVEAISFYNDDFKNGKLTKQ